MSSATSFNIVDYIDDFWRWFLSRVYAARPETDHALQRFLSESVDILRRLSSLKLAHLLLAVLLIVTFILSLSWALWRLRVSRYNEFWGLKKSVHFWTSFRSSAQPHYCSACSQLICGFWIFRNTGWECTVCGRTAHMRCVAACDKFDCKCPSQSEPLRHQLVQGNLPSDSVCGVCGIICASPFGLHGLRCLWCGRTVHEECLRHLPEICDLGLFRGLVLPPSIVRLSVVSSRRPNSLASLQSFGALFHSKKSEALEETPTALSVSAQRYMRSMGAQLKEGLSQVQVAMAAGLFEGLKEVTADVKRINQLVRQEFRRRMKRELHQQHKEDRLMKMGSQDLLVPTDACATPNIQRSDPFSEIITDGNGTRRRDVPMRRCSSVPHKTRQKERIQKKRSMSSDWRSSSEEGGPRQKKIISSIKRPLAKGRRIDDQGLLDATTTTDETPEFVDSSGKRVLIGASLISSRSEPINLDELKHEEFVSLEELKVGEDRQRDVNGTTSPKALTSDSRPSLSQSCQTLASREARLRYRDQRFRRLERKRLTAAAGALVVREDRYGDRLFELAKLMPAKADVWEIDISDGIRSRVQSVLAVPNGVRNGTNDKRKRQRSKNGHLDRSYGISSSSFRSSDLVPVKMSSGTSRSNQSEMVIPNALIERKPLLVFVNVKSGGQVGAQLMKEFYRLLNPMQVVDIQSDGGPQRALALFKDLADIDRLRVLVCGGDGTAGWVIDEIRELYGPPTQCHVPVGILPLGTGNDLARVLGWGDSFDGDVQRCLMRVESAQTRLLDQWSLKIQGRENNEIVNTCFNNYMDIGVAARIALKFHQLREAHPELFQSRLGNKFLYGEMGVREWVTERTLDLSKVRLWCDGLPVILPERNIEGLIVVNIPSFSGGVNLWSDEDVDQTAIDFRRYRYDNSHHDTSTHQTRQSTDRNRRQWRGRMEDETNIWSPSRPSMLPNSPDQYLTSSTSRPPLPPRKHDAVSHSPPRDDSDWKKRQGRNRPPFSRNEKCAHSVEPSHCRNRNDRTEFHGNSDGYNTIGQKSYNSRPHEGAHSEEVSVLSPPPSFDSDFQQISPERLSQSSQSSDVEPPAIKLAFARPRENSRSVADFRNPHRPTAPSGVLDHRMIHTISAEQNFIPIYRASPRWQKQSMRDELIEVVAVRSLFHLGQIQVGLAEPLRVCQGRDIKIEIPVEVPFQIDGEPRMLPPHTTIDISYKGKSFVLSPVRSHDDALMLSVTEVLDAAVRDSVLTGFQRNCLVWELSKRL